MAIRPSGADLETARQDRARKRDDDEVAHLEVMGAADNSPGARVVVVIGDVHPAIADRLAVAVVLDLVGHHSTDDQRARDISTGVRDRLNLQARSDQGFAKAASIKIIGKRSK